MGRRRKTVIGSTIANEDKTSNAYPRTTSTDENIHVHTDNSDAMEGMYVENNAQPNSNGLPANMKKMTGRYAVVRQSGRLKCPVLRSGSRGVKPVVEHVILAENENEEAPHSHLASTLPILKEKNSNLQSQVQQATTLKSSVLPSGSQGVNPAVEHVNLAENEKDEEPHSHLVSTLPVLKEKRSNVEPQVQQATTLPDEDERNLEEKVDYLVQVADEFHSKVIESPHEGHSPNFSYKSLYIKSQKKIEALVEANYELVKNLQFALGKVEAYEKMVIALGASKEVLLVSTPGNETEATLSLPQQIQKSNHPPDAAATPEAADDPKQKKKNYRKRKGKA